MFYLTIISANARGPYRRRGGDFDDWNDPGPEWTQFEPARRPRTRDLRTRHARRHQKPMHRAGEEARARGRLPSVQFGSNPDRLAARGAWHQTRRRDQPRGILVPLDRAARRFEDVRWAEGRGPHHKHPQA